jgi:hypothetical protein
MIEQSIVHLPELVKDIDWPVFIYLVQLSSSRIKCQEGFLEPLARNAWQTPARYGSETKRSSGHFAEGVRTIVGSKAGNPGVRMASRFAYVDGASGMLARSRIQ